MYGHDSPGGGQGAVVAAGRLHHVAEPEDVAQPGLRVPGVVGAHRVVYQVVAMILVSEIRKPNMSVVRKPDNIFVKLETNSGKTAGIYTSDCFKYSHKVAIQTFNIKYLMPNIHVRYSLAKVF